MKAEEETPPTERAVKVNCSACVLCTRWCFTNTHRRSVRARQLARNHSDDWDTIFFFLGADNIILNGTYHNGNQFNAYSENFQIEILCIYRASPPSLYCLFGILTSLPIILCMDVSLARKWEKNRGHSCVCVRTKLINFGEVLFVV